MAAGVGAQAWANVTADLADLDLGANQYWNGSDGSGGFSSQAIRFGNQFTDWGGGFALDGFRIDPASAALDDAASWDGSGTPNLLAYALGREPGGAVQSGMEPGNTGAGFEVFYSRRADLPDAGIGIEACTDLRGMPVWTTNGVAETDVSTNAGVVTVRATIGTGDPTGFARLRAWRK
jgi:hypothetical protein